MGMAALAAALIAASAVVAAILRIFDCAEGSGMSRRRQEACVICGMPIERGDMSERFGGSAKAPAGEAHSSCVTDLRAKGELPEPPPLPPAGTMKRPDDPCLGGPAIGLRTVLSDDGRSVVLERRWGIGARERRGEL